MSVAAVAGPDDYQARLGIPVGLDRIVLESPADRAVGILLLARRLSSGQVIRAGSSVESFAMSSMPTYLLAPQRHAYVSSRIWLGLS